MINLLNTEKECIEYIHSCGRFGKKEGLSNMRALLNALGNPHKDLQYIHVAGTNGKGSAVCMLSNVLIFHGYKVGTNTSPYIERFNERLQINNIPIPSQKLIYYTNAVKNAIDKLNNQDCHPIEFEIITAIGFLYFRDEKCDYVILECGIGGRFDSTNVIENPLLCVICNIGLDHTEILGNTVKDIAAEKAGIIKQGTTVVMHPYISKEAADVVKKTVSERNAILCEYDALPRIVSTSLEGTDFEFENKIYHIKLLGSYQPGNAALAVKAAEVLAHKEIVDENDILSGLSAAKWKCRFEYIRTKYNYIIDGAHNYQGICEFAKSINMYLPDRRKVFVIGMLNEKDFEKSSEVLKTLGGKIIVTDVPSIRQTSGKAVYDAVKSRVPDAEYIPGCTKAAEYAEKLAGYGGFVCIAGSLYLAGAARTYVLNKKSC